MTLENTYNRDAKTKLYTGISQQPATMVKYWRALTVLTAESEQTKPCPTCIWMTPSTTMTPTGKPKRGRELYTRRHQQMNHPFKYEEQDMVHVSTGHKDKYAVLARTRGIGMLTAPVAARETGSEKVSKQNWSHLPKSLLVS